MEDIFLQVYTQIKKRIEEGNSDSYSYALAQKGTEKILKKIGEEFLEVALATEQKNNEKTEQELADLLYHILVLMVTLNISPDAISGILHSRLGISGIQEKNSRRKNNE